MISQISVSGFRSLVEFKIEFSEGLNVLVGQNGSGKTNFINSMDFLSELTNEGIHTAFGNAGGTNRVFSEEVLKKRTKSVSYEVRGDFDKVKISQSMQRYYNSSKEQGPPLVPEEYIYKISVKYDKAAARVFVAEEDVLLKFPNTSNITIKRRNKFTEDGFKSVVTIHPKNNRHVKTMIARRRIIGQDDLSAYIDRFSRLTCDENSFLNMLGYDFISLRLIQTEIKRLKSINVEPACAREPSLISDSPGLTSSGEGLARTLWEIIEKESGTNKRRYSYESSTARHSYEEIVGWVAEVNPDIKDIRVKVDQSRGVIMPSIVFDLDGAEKIFTFDKVSDGTIKWIVLCVDLLFSNKFTAIEEPENFLHPRMQELFVELIRNVCERNSSLKIVTTHSESLLNLCRAEELIVFDYDENGTRARRPENKQNLQDVIDSSDFNLGYFYRTGAVSG